VVKSPNEIINMSYEDAQIILDLLNEAYSLSDRGEIGEARSRLEEAIDMIKETMED
jgi:flagellin-specific chaperone FliS